MRLLAGTTPRLALISSNTMEHARMPLSGKLSDVSIDLECPHCGHRLTKNGNWLRSVQHFNCVACLRRVRIGYSDKVRLFAKHAHLVKQPPTRCDAPGHQLRRQCYGPAYCAQYTRAR